MAPRNPQPQTPFERFVQPLKDLAYKDPLIEAWVFWGEENGFDAQPSEALESEEIVYWIEGLLPEGFKVEWRVIAIEGDDAPDHIRLYAWEEGEAPAPEPAEVKVVAQGRWPVQA